jgi:hypothetical protein
MQLVLRPINDQFFQEIVFPILEMGMVSSEVALTRLRPQLADARVGMLLDKLLDQGAAAGTALWGLDQGAWLDTIHRLLFSEWTKQEDGWTVVSEFPGFAADWQQMMHVGLMVDSPHYPYDDEAASQQIRNTLSSEATQAAGLAAFFAGVWDPPPRFPAHEVLHTIEGRGIFKGDVCLADWSYRSANTVALWAQQLSTKLGRLLRREESRLGPVPVPESKAILEYWYGTEPFPPPLTVAFSGLGADSGNWIRNIGEVASHIRAAANSGQGLSMIVTQGESTFEARYL